MEASARIVKEVFQLVIRRSNVLIERLSICTSAPRVCAVQVSLHYDSVVLLFVDPILRCGPHVGLSSRIGSRELVDIYDLECGSGRSLCLSNLETTVYFPAGVEIHLSGVMAAHLCDFGEKGRAE